MHLGAKKAVEGWYTVMKRLLLASVDQMDMLSVSSKLMAAALGSSYASGCFFPRRNELPADVDSAAIKAFRRIRIL